jgi:hypothetical protein
MPLVEPHQRVQIPAVLDFPGDDVLAGHPGNGSPEIRRQEVMDGPVPAAHAGPDRFLLDVLRESRPFLGQLGVVAGGEIAHGVEGMLVAFEEHLLGVFTEETAQAAVHGLLFGSSQIGAEATIALLDELAVDVQIIGRNDCLDVLALATASDEYRLKV